MSTHKGIMHIARLYRPAIMIINRPGVMNGNMKPTAAAANAQ